MVPCTNKALYINHNRKSKYAYTYELFKKNSFLQLFVFNYVSKYAYTHELFVIFSCVY